MPPSEMQEMEIEMVQGMYDTFKLLSDDPPRYSVELSPNADTTTELLVTVEYPPTYPEEAACVVELANISKLHRFQLGDITKHVQELCEELVGTHAVVMVLQAVQDFLVTAAEEEERQELARRGEALNAAASVTNKNAAPVLPDPTIRIGTLVTKEDFEVWSRKRQQEKAKERAEREKKEARQTSSKLTGRQLWDNTLKSADWTLFGGDADADAGEDVDFDHLDDMDEDDFDLE